jgi:3-oxoacyl-[acyl-carrier protein] reductase
MVEPLLSGRVAVVTGAAQGIGRAIASLFVHHGATTVLLDIDNAAAAKAAAAVSADEPGAAIGGPACDVADEQSLQEAVDYVMAAYGRLDVFVNNAGITRDASLRRMTVEQFDEVIRVNLRGVWLGTRAACAIMREQGSGSIVNLSSLSGKSGNAGQTNYAAAKAGVVGLTKSAAKEVAHHGVRVNAIQPGLIQTPMTAAMPPDVFAAKAAEIPMQRAGRPEEIAGAALFLASDLSSFMTGAVLEVTGGRFM